MPGIARFAVAFAVAVGVGCGSHETGTTIGKNGGTVKTTNARLDIPAGALQSDTRITLREVQGPTGTVRSVEIEPSGLALATPARVSIKDDGSQGPFRIVDTQTQQTLGRSCHDASWHQHSGDVTNQGTVDLSHGAACNPACAAGQYCVDVACRTPDAFWSQCGAACGPSGCDGWMCGCCGGMCGCPNCCNGGQCCSGGQCCNYGNGMCCGDMCCGDRCCGGHC